MENKKNILAGKYTLNTYLFYHLTHHFIKLEATTRRAIK